MVSLTQPLNKPFSSSYIRIKIKMDSDSILDSNVHFEKEKYFVIIIFTITLKFAWYRILVKNTKWRISR